MSFTCLNESDQFLDIIKTVVISEDTLTVIDDAVLFVYFKTVGKLFLAYLFANKVKQYGFIFDSIPFRHSLVQPKQCAAFFSAVHFLFSNHPLSGQSSEDHPMTSPISDTSGSKPQLS